MSDEIKGIAVLDDRNAEQFLFVACVADHALHGDHTDTRIIRLPVRQRGAPKVGENQWEYDVAGESLNVTPSVRVSVRMPEPGQEDRFPEIGRDVELFHNGGSWSVRFLRWSEIKDWPELDEDSRYMACRVLNAALFARA